MSACAISQNTPPPAWARVLTEREVTPAIVAEAWTIAGDGAIPIGYERKANVSSIPLLFRCECHSYTIVGGKKISGLYHGCTVYRITDPSQNPSVTPGPEPAPPPGPLPIIPLPRTTDWAAVAASGVAIAGVVGLFWLALRKAGR